jgi:hypothetical protein
MLDRFPSGSTLALALGAKHGINANFEQILTARRSEAGVVSVEARGAAPLGTLQKRGVRSSQKYGVAELDTDVPSRRSSLLSPA